MAERLTCARRLRASGRLADKPQGGEMEDNQTAVRRRRRWQQVWLVCAAVAAAACLAACGSASSGGSGGQTSNAGVQASSSSGSSASGASNSASTLAFLNAPAGAKVLAPEPGPLVTTPVTHEQVHLNWGKVDPVPAGPILNPNKQYTVCFSQGLVNNPWSTAQRESVMLEAARHPNLKVLYFNTNDANQQVQDLQTCEDKKVDAILVWPQTVGPLTPEINKLCKDHALVIGMERTVATRCYTSWLFLDYPGAAANVAKAIATDLHGKGTVVESQGTPGSSPQILRHKYFADTLAKYPGIKLLETDPTDFGASTAYQVALNFLHSPEGEQKISAWYSQYEQEAIGIAAALRQVHRNIPQYTIGGTRQVICMVQSGKVKFLEPGSGTPLHGDLALRLAIMKLEGKQIPQNLLLTSPPAITAANAKQAFASEGWGPGC
jgi:galactofuranose transport system substrate-binding protein